MECVDGRKVAWEGYRLQATRGESSVTQKRLLVMDREGPGDFDFCLLRILTKYHAPRHRHNWCQIRYTLEGAQNYMPDRDIPEGVVAYFPEGTWYGPQNVEGPMTQMLLQFGGPSRNGYMSHEDVTHATAELSKAGRFVKGTYETVGADGTVRREDGYEATWRQVFGRPIAYPKPQYAEPILMNPAHFEWEPVAGAAGNHVKRLGTFSGGRVDIRMVRTDQGHAYVQGAEPKRELLFVIEGELDGAEASLGAQSTLYTEERERTSFVATKSLYGLLITLPSFTD